MINILLKAWFLLSIFVSLQLNAQLSTREMPISFNYNLNLDNVSIPVMVMHKIDTAALFAEDEIEEQQGFPPRFGFSHEVNINLLNTGIWHTLPDSTNVCLLTITCPGALSINLLYDSFWLPQGAKLFIYSKNREHYIGAFTDFNNNGTKDYPESFATGLVYSDTIIIEYYLPKDCKDTGIVYISGVVQGYKYINLGYEYGYGRVPDNGWNRSSNCQVNINCSPEGDEWQNEKRAVALYLIGGDRVCTGSLMNNTANDYHPYFLTAYHCINLPGRRDFNKYTFYWNYESPVCFRDTNYVPDSLAPKSFSTSRARLLAESYYSDFALLELIEDPRNLCDYPPNGFSPYYLGWDATGDSNVAGGVCIHHPNNDVKKIATYNIIPTTTDCMYPQFSYNYFWKVTWQQTPNGLSVTEGGSSGSALLNSQHRVIGQLYGPGGCYNIYCDTNKVSNYGKFNISWNFNNHSNARLSNWLDKIGTGALVLDGISYGSDYAQKSYIIRLHNKVAPYDSNDIYLSNGDCINSPTFPSDTLYYKIDSVEQCLSNINAILYFDGINGIDNASFYIGSLFVQAGATNSQLGWFFDLSDYSYIWEDNDYTDEYIIVKAVLPDGTDIVFKFKVNTATEETITEHWAEVGFEYDAETGTINADLKSGDLYIPLPDLGCEIVVEPNDYNIVETEEGNKNLLIPQTEECEDIDIKIKYDCECIGAFNFKVHNTDCESQPTNCCESVSMEINKRFGLVSHSGAGFGELELPKFGLPVSNVVITSKCDIENINVTFLAATNRLSYSISLDEKFVKFLAPIVCHHVAPGLYDHSVDVEICITTTNGENCCDTLRIVYFCGRPIKEVKVFPSPVSEEMPLSIQYELYEEALTMQTPLNIAIYDNDGYKKINIMNTIPTQLSTTLAADISSFPPGTYHVLFQMGNQIESVKFIKQ